jgi:adenine-specific DNA-methyltransferase
MQKFTIKNLLHLLHTGNQNKLLSCGNLDFFKNDLLTDKLYSMAASGKESAITGVINSLNPGYVFQPANRKYLGSKSNLLSFIEQTIVAQAGRTIESFFDPFAGTGVVAFRMQEYADKIIANDLLYSNYLGLKVFLQSLRHNTNVKKINDLITHLNSLDPVKGYVFSNFAGTYFTPGNAGKIDAIREEIDRLEREKACSFHEKEALLVSLLYAMDKCANTVGQYDAFLKHIGSEIMAGGKHRVDSNVYKSVTLKRPFFFFDSRNDIFNTDANNLAESVHAEVVYLDPPYNKRQYINCYHLLENVMLWKKPVTTGKTKKFKRDHMKSDYSRKTKAVAAFADLISKLTCRHLFLSYNTEGIIPDDDIFEILKTRGKLEIFKQDYAIFGNGAGVSRKRPVCERLFYVKVNKK